MADIAPVCQELGIPHTALHPDGKPHFTLPALIDVKDDTASTVVIADSQPIIEYLDRTYPSPPPLPALCTQESLEFLRAFNEYLEKELKGPYGRLTLPYLHQHKPPGDRAIFEAKILKMTGKAIDELEPKGEEKDQLYRKLGEALRFRGLRESDADGFLRGNDISIADFVLAGWIFAAFQMGGELRERLEGLDGGRIHRYTGRFANWTATEG